MRALRDPYCGVFGALICCPTGPKSLVDFGWRSVSVCGRLPCVPAVPVLAWNTALFLASETVGDLDFSGAWIWY